MFTSYSPFINVLLVTIGVGWALINVNSILWLSRWPEALMWVSSRDTTILFYGWTDYYTSPFWSTS